MTPASLPPRARGVPLFPRIAVAWLAVALAAFPSSLVHAQAAGGAAPEAAAPAAPASPAVAPATPSTPATTPTTTPSATGAAADPLTALAWLQGCWRGTVNQREFREQWLPPAGGMMIGAGHTVIQGRTQDFEYLRLETRPQGLHYVTVASGQKEATFRFEGATRDEINPADIFTFANTVEGYPQRIVYRHGNEGWLYAQVEGSLNGVPRNVTYPMRHVDCESGEVIRK